MEPDVLVVERKLVSRMDASLKPRLVIERLVLATHNPGKVVEIRPMLAGYVGEIVCAGDLGLPEPEETGSSFPENAALKARAAMEGSGLPSLADDSGLCVSALNGAPGIYSARWAGANRDFSLAMERVQKEIGTNPDRAATFVCALALAWPDGRLDAFEGRMNGKIVWPARGNKGFGYDPIFVPNGCEKTCAEMDPSQKDSLSHRRRAFEALVTGLFLA